MIYVLIMVLSTIQGEAIHSQEFHSKQSCNEARLQLKEHGVISRAICVKK